jgi:hypothetical protein
MKCQLSRSPPPSSRPRHLAIRDADRRPAVCPLCLTACLPTLGLSRRSQQLHCTLPTSGAGAMDCSDGGAPPYNTSLLAVPTRAVRASL